MTTYLAPAPKFQAFDVAGAPIVGGKVYTYASGASVTPLTTYTDSGGLTANANPVILDSRGEANIWFTPAVLYRVVLKDSSDNVLYTVDNVAGSVTPSAYFATLMQSTSATQFAGDIFASGGTVTGTIIMSGAAVNFAADVNIASATTTNIGAAASNNLTVTGVATINAFDNVTAGMHRYLTFTGALTLTYNATSMILPTAANITTAAGDTALFKSLGSGNWKCLFYIRADGTALAGNTAAATQAQMEAASSTTVMVTPGRTVFHPGVAKAWVNFTGSNGAVNASQNVTSVTRNSSGNYTVTFTTAFSSGSYAVAATCQGSVSGGSDNIVVVVPQANAPTASACRLACYRTNDGGVLDPLLVFAQFFGDQA